MRDNAPTSTIGWSAVTAWAALTAKTAGQLVRQLATPTVGNERVFACIIAGTTLAAEPTWTVTKGAKTAEAAGPTWQEVTGQPGVNGDTTNSPTWLQNKNTAVTLGLIIYDSVSAALQIVSTAGTTGNGAAPSFSATAGTTTADNTVTWTSLGLASGFGAWAAPHARRANAYTTNWVAAGNTVYVGDDHAETQAAALTNTSPGTATNPCFCYCIDHTVSLPPTSSNLKTTALVITTGNNSMTINGSEYCYGITFQSGTGAVGATIGITGAWQKFEACAFQKLGTSGASTAISINSSMGLELINTTLKFGSTGDNIRPQNLIKWSNTASAISGATIPTTLFSIFAATTCIFDGVDLSAVTGTLFNLGTANWAKIYLLNCELGAGVTEFASNTNSPNCVLYNVSSDSAATNYRSDISAYQATLVASTSLVRTGGASNGTTAESWQIATTANSTWIAPFESFPIPIWNTVTGTNRVVTLYGLWNSASLPNNDQVWVEVEYLGNASFPIASFATQTKANNLAAGSALSADSTSQWGSAATARQNSHAYVVGNVIAVADATAGGTIFFCTVSGTSAGSEPGGYATAVDGGVVTDGTATFRAATRFILTITLSAPQPQLAGYLRATIKAALASSTFFVDPFINLS